MKPDASTAPFTALKTALQRLQNTPLPPETKTLLLAAIRELDELPDKYEPGGEQPRLETLAEENTRLNQAVEQANQGKTKFISVVTHELRIPMTSIKGYTDLLRQGAVGPLNEQQIDFLNVIRNNVERMSALVSNLSDISRIETGRLKLEIAPLPLDTYIEETLRSLHPRFEEKKQYLEIDLPRNLPPLSADPNRLVQVLTNLLSNANKYTPEGGRIRVHAQQEGEDVRVEISDSGIGIGQEDQAKLFSQFFRSEDPTVREQQGWGLGLNLTQKLVDLMGGSIGARSVFGQGSTFWFTLPLARDNHLPKV